MDKDRLSQISALALNTIFGNEPRFSHNIIDALGSCEAVFKLSEKELLELFGPYNRYLPLIGEGSLRVAEREYNRLTALGYQFLDIFDDAYPALLRDCPDAPIILYIRSSTTAGELFNGRPAVSIVGTRDMSLYGREYCRQIVAALSKSPDKPLIVSGLAMGIDITAQLAAIGFGLPTIAVLPVGIEDVYPHRHTVAAEKIASSPGSALITDYPPGTVPQAFNFLRRNRIIAGLSSATILVESRIKGGGMMTARLASGYGRDVFALQGRIDDVRSQGCNLLLKEKIAEPIDSLDGLCGSLGLTQYKPYRVRDLRTALADRLGSLVPTEEMDSLTAIAEAIRSRRGINLDELCAETDMDYSEVSRKAGLLENEGFIEIDLLQRCSITVKNV